MGKISMDLQGLALFLRLTFYSSIHEYVDDFMSTLVILQKAAVTLPDGSS